MVIHSIFLSAIAPTPSEEVNLYQVITQTNKKGLLVVGFGEHIDAQHAESVNELLRNRNS